MNKTVPELRRFRERKGRELGLDREITFEQAGALVGVNKTTWHGWEKRGKKPAASLMPKVCELVGASADIFYPRPIVQPNTAGDQLMLV